MFLKTFVKDYLTFGKRDRLGLLALIFLILLIYLLPKFFPGTPKALAIKESEGLKLAMDTLSNQRKKEHGNDENEGPSVYPLQRGNAPAETFRFDPNTLSPAGWQRLGLSARTSKTIENYRNKGGRFYRPEDLKKIWGLPPGFYEKVKDQISLSTDQPNLAADDRAEFMSKEKPATKPAMLDINEVDTTAFILLPGIGSKLASRIVIFREKLGGFYSVDQLAETYGLADSIFRKLRPRFQLGDRAVRKLNINSATKDELKVHPYLKWSLSNAIVEYRNQHGKYNTLDELKAIKLISEATFKKIAPYLIL